MREEQVRRWFHQTLGEPADAPAATRRLEDFLDQAAAIVATERRRSSGHALGAVLAAAALAALLVAGLVATRAAGQPRSQPAPAASRPALAAGCLAGVPARLVIVDLDAQRLTAYQDGCPVLTTPVTTGGSSSPTPAGTYHVLFMAGSHMLQSPWPRGNPHWYPDIPVHDYLALTDDGIAIHSAEWEPAAEFGPGSQAGPDASHGDVNVPEPAAHQLYKLIALGTEVRVRGGGQPPPTSQPAAPTGRPGSS